jgi:hypothetical protein
MEGVAAALEPRQESIGWVAAPTYELARRVFGRMQLVVAQHLQHRLIEMNERERWFKILNMAGGVSEVRAKTCDSSVSLLGEALDWLVLDEAARISRDVWESALSQRLLDKGGWALLISTPRRVNWFFEQFRLGQKGRDAGVESWCQPTWANPFIDRERVEQERGRLTEDAFNEEYGAQFLGSEDEPCESCGYPDPDAPGLLISSSDDDLRKCAECEHLVDKNGRTLVKKLPGYGPDMRVILLRPDPAEQFTPELPVEADGCDRAVEDPVDFEEDLRAEQEAETRLSPRELDALLARELAEYESRQATE